MNNLAIIPARGGSKRIPRKNVKKFSGKPMIAWSIELALRSQLFSRVIVSTDDDEIADVAASYGAEVPFRRPEHLSGDFVGTREVIDHAIEVSTSLDYKPDTACCMYPCAPFLSPDNLAAAIAKLDAAGIGSFLYPVIEFPAPIERAMRMDTNGRIRPVDPSAMLTRTQDLAPAYYDAGQFYWGHVETWLSGKPISDDALTIVLDASQVVDIDTPADWVKAESIAAHSRRR